MASVFLDASAWVALGNKKDHYHNVAQAIYEKILRERMVRVTSTWTIYEALSILKSRVGYDRARELWEIVTQPRLVSMMPVDIEIEESAVDIFFRYRDKDWGIIDCSSLIVIERTGCKIVVAFDLHFSQAAKQFGLNIWEV